MPTLNGQKEFGLPQLMVWTDVEPVQNEDGSWNIYDHEDTNYLILSDHNRGPLDIGKSRIEKRERMINGKMRSYHIADKETFSVSWDMLPSRSYYSYDGDGDGQMYTADGGAGGAEVVEWYNNHEGSFYMLLAYDALTMNVGDTEIKTAAQSYNRMVPVFFSDFSYTIVKRGSSTHDFWNISLGLEEE